MKKQNSNISDYEQKNVKVHRNVASKKMKVGVMWSALFVLAVIGVLSVIGAVLSIKPKTETENKNLVTYASMPLEIQDGVITKYNGTTDGTAVLNIPATYDVVDGELVAGDTYKITGIGENVFKDVNFALLTVNLDNITRIGDSAFENATRVAFVGGEGYTIGKNAFKNASVALEEVKVLPNGEEPAVDVDAFSGTTFLKSLKSPNSLSAEEVSSATAFKTTAVRGIIKFASGSLKQASSVDLSGFSGKVIFADNCAKDSTSLGAVTLNSKLSVDIGANAFANTQNGNFAISGNANFRQIGSFAFSSSRIQSLNLSTSSLKTIAQGMFSECGSLTSITLPSSVTSIGNEAFWECHNLASITIPSSVTSIGERAFESCEAFTSITIPNSVTSIGAGAFKLCTDLNSITIEGYPGLGFGTFDNTNNCDINVRGAILVYAYNAPDPTWSVYASRLVCPYLVVQYNDGGSTNIGEIEVGKTITSTTLTSTMVDGGTISSPKANILKAYIPKCVTTIESQAFWYCSGLTSITIPDGVTSIGNGAFFGCSGLASITIGSGVTSIGNGAFSSCSNLTSITIPSRVTTIGGGVFQNCSGLTSISIPDGVTSIGNNAFDGCSNLTSITIPDGVTSIGNCAFYNCSKLTSVTIGSGVTSIGDAAFADCTGLEEVTIEATSIPTLGLNVFDNTNNCDINVRGAVLVAAETYANWSTYKDRLACPYLVVQYKSGSNTLVGEIEVDTTIDSTTLTSKMVGGGTIFSPETNVLKAYIPKGVTKIGGVAFRRCSGLTSITIPNSITTIESSAFSDCTGLTSISIPDRVTSIGSYAFYSCSSLTSITIEATTLPTLGSSAFDYTNNCYINVRGAVLVAAETATNWSTYKDRLVCPYLVVQYKSGSDTLVGEIEVGTTITSSTLTSTMVGGGNISAKSDVLKAYIPKCVTSIGGSAFGFCSGLTSITIPSSVTSIGDSAFVFSGLNSITIEGTTTPTLGSNAFDFTDDCDINVASAQFVMSAFSNASWSNYLDRLAYPNLVVQYKSGSTTKVGEIKVGTTIDSSTLTSTMVGGGTISSPKTNVLKVYIPKCVTTIGTFSTNSSNNYGFNGYTSLTSVSIPNSVTRIGMIAFMGCTSLASVTIPSSVSRIGVGAFRDCTALGSINVNCTTIPTLDLEAFDNTNNCPIYVPSAKVSTYKSASGWKNYKGRIQAKS